MLNVMPTVELVGRFDIRAARLPGSVARPALLVRVLLGDTLAAAIVVGRRTREMKLREVNDGPIRRRVRSANAQEEPPFLPWHGTPGGKGLA